MIVRFASRLCTLKASALALALLPLAGCGMLDLAETQSRAYKRVETDLDTFLVSEDAAARKIEVTANAGAKASAFMNRILTLGISYPDAREDVMKDAAAVYLKRMKDNCSIKDGKRIERMRWEFHYECEMAPAETR